MIRQTNLIAFSIYLFISTNSSHHLCANHYHFIHVKDKVRLMLSLIFTNFTFVSATSFFIV